MTLPAILPAGVAVRDLTPHADDRGTFLELHRLEWETGIAPVQWNAVRTEAGVLRGVHCHWRHDDYLTVVDGVAEVGLCDLRPDMPTYRQAACLRLDAARPQALTIPTGVAHGFYFPEPSLHVYAVSHYWSLDDELGCRWDDPALGIPWPQPGADVSPRDEALPPLAELERSLARVLNTGARVPE
jgi:dTDP-4-dehydrorhamnose 3,5-epimerase